MKKLQNNYTTPEQSKRLLEIGVPADSADCFFMTSNPGEEQFPNIIPIVDDGKICFSLFCDERAVPCWSAGRLIEIYETCTSCFFGRRFMQHSVLEDVLLQITEDIASTDECWDFSKLED